MKYLGLTLDGRWNFGPHLIELFPKPECAAAVLARLLPNVRGPGSACKRLYAGIVQSMALYGAWVPPSSQTLSPPRIEFSWGYRIGSRSRINSECGPDTQDQCSGSESPARLVDRGSGVSCGGLSAIRPHKRRWVKRRHGVYFRLTQVLTRHGCFGKYLHQIVSREATPACHTCGEPSDTACHTRGLCCLGRPCAAVPERSLKADLHKYTYQWSHSSVNVSFQYRLHRYSVTSVIQLTHVSTQFT